MKKVHVKRVLALFLAAMLCLQSLAVYAEPAAESADGVVETLAAPELKAEYSGGAVVLTWKSSGTPDVVGILRAEAKDGSYTWLTAVSGSSYTDLSAEKGKTYWYKIYEATKKDGAWVNSSPTEAVMVKAESTTSLSLSGEGGSVKLSWTMEEKADVVGILRAESKDGSYTWINAVAASSYEDKSVTPGKTYWYKIYPAVREGSSWKNGAACEAQEILVKGTEIVLEAPTDVNVTSKTETEAEITWKAGAGCTAYLVYRSEDGGDWTVLCVTGETKASDKTVKAGASYRYRVQGAACADSKWSYTGVITSADFKMGIPVPSDIKVSLGEGGNALKISWARNMTSGVTGVLRSESETGTYTWLGAVSASSYTDKNLVPGKTYYYKVYNAVYASGVWTNGEYSAAASGTVMDVPTGLKASVEAQTITVSWNKVEGSQYYAVWRQEEGGEWTCLQFVPSCTYVDSQLKADRNYSYKVQTANKVDSAYGFSSVSDVITAKTEKVTLLVKAVQDTTRYYGITLSWNTELGADAYGIMRSEHGKNSYQWLAAVSGSSYCDTTGTPGATYDYKVYPAYKVGGSWNNGSFSAAVSQKVRAKDGAPVISNVTVTNVTSDGYLICCNVASASPLKRVAFPSWTTANGQDEIVWRDGCIVDGWCAAWVYSKEHNYEVGQYETAIYAYDSNGQSAQASAKATVPVFTKAGTGTGWYDTNGSLGDRYYLYNGTAVTGWKYIGGLKYYFYPNGILCQNVDKLIGVQSRYEIKVNKQANCVTIYADDGSGNYCVPVKAMLCSTGDDTPMGVIHTLAKSRWNSMINGTYGQYCTRLQPSPGALFHSVTYEKRDIHTLIAFGYNGLGVVRSAGCIRLQCGEAFWIYTRCVVGTKVTIYQEEKPGPFYRPVVPGIPDDQNYDPTDPAINPAYQL